MLAAGAAVAPRMASASAGTVVDPPASASVDAAAPPAPAAVCKRMLCPDLIMSAPSDLHFDRSTLPGRVLLRATSSIHNRGAGPLELRAHRAGPRRWRVYQAVYTRGPSRRRLFRTSADLVYKYVPGERYGFAGTTAASYWKLEEAAVFELWAIDTRHNALRLVRRGPKVDYCLRDLFHTRPSRSSPEARVYQACSENPGITRDVLGTSPGWADVYPYEYPEQWIDVTGLHGRFAYVQIVDPGRRLIEANQANDVSETFIQLPSGRVLGHRGGISVP
jgi:Lysyl oxidase